MRQKRFRDWGPKLLGLEPGPLNAITDVEGVQVGHCTVIKGPSVRTGVTAILPHSGSLYQEKVPAAVEIINGFGKAAGLAQVMELGELETPILLTNTLSVGIALDALVQYKLDRNPEIGREEPTVNGVVAECNDGYLNDIRGRHVTKEHVWEAIRTAGPGLPREGSVGAGTGMKSFECKGGIGTSSRRTGDYTVGVLVLSNFGKWYQLKVAGIPVGRWLKSPAPPDNSREQGSIIMVLATDAPLDSLQLKRVARRAGFGLARTGSVAGNGSGDFVIAFSTGTRYRHTRGIVSSCITMEKDEIDGFFEAAVEATEEAIINALFTAGEMIGRDGNMAPSLPLEAVVELLNRCSPTR